MNKIRWIDSHCHPHLFLDKRENYDMELLKEAIEENIRLLCVGVELSDYEMLSKYAKLFPQNVNIALGHHPMNENIANEEWELFANIVSKDLNIVAIGETGFDFQGDMQKQHMMFEKHIEIAKIRDLPIVLHSRDMEEKTKEAIKLAKRSYNNLRGVFHCFTGSIELADFAIEMGWYISFSGIITFKNAHLLSAVALHLFKNNKLDSILIETDAPYLAPQPMRGKPNKPLYIKYIGEFLAHLFELEPAVFAQKVEANFNRFLNIPNSTIL